MYNNDIAEKKIGTIRTNTTVAKVKWDLVPDGTAKGSCEYTITVTGIIEGKEYRTSVSRKLLIDKEVVRPPDLETPKTNRPVKPEVKITYSKKYYFDFSRINGILDEINRNLENSDALLNMINSLLSAKPMNYDPKLKEAHLRTTQDIATNLPGLTTRIQDAGQNVIHVQTLTNKSQ
jgi:hypothetical protein